MAISNRKIAKILGVNPMSLVASLLTPLFLMGGTAVKLHDRNPKPIAIEEQANVMDIADGWYIQPLSESAHPFDDLSKELAYRGFANPISIPNKSGDGYRISANSIQEAMEKATYLSGMYSNVLIINAKEGKPWYQALRILSEEEMRKDSKGLLGSPSDLEELVRQEGEFIKNDPSNKGKEVPDWKLVLALIAAESNFDPEARGIKLKPIGYRGNGRYSFVQQRDGSGNFDYSGARGYGQIKDIAARDVGIAPEDLNHRRLDIRAPYLYLTSLIQQFGDVEIAVYAYNRGPTATKRDMDGRGLKYPESINHANKVMELYREARVEELRRQRANGSGA